MNFIKRLTEEYGEYIDLIKPIQVAVYEMKLGLAIALSGSLQREYLKRIKEDDIERVLVCIFLNCMVHLCIFINNISNICLSVTIYVKL
jgi:midasin